jgi:hypothetical protein
MSRFITISWFITGVLSRPKGFFSHEAEANNENSL